MRDNGYTVEVNDVQNLAVVKTQYHVPAELQTCHTAIVDGYVIEGHVPVAEIERLLTERPDVLGLAVPGMPPGSPGMDSAGSPSVPYQVWTFDASGPVEVYAQYGG